MWTAIISAIQTFPSVLKLVQSFVEEFELSQLSRIDQVYSEKDTQRRALLSVLKKSTVTDAERMAMIKLLYDLNHSDN